MNVLLLDTNVVSVLFNKNHSLRPACIEAVAGRQLVISFMSLAELLLWPAANNWGASRRSALETHLGRYTTLYPDGRTCAIWSEIVDHCRRAGKPIHTADAWIASTALQWRIPLVTADFRDYEVIDDLEVVPIRWARSQLAVLSTRTSGWRAMAVVSDWRIGRLSSESPLLRNLGRFLNPWRLQRTYGANPDAGLTV